MAAAGCGKTQLVVDALASIESGRSLILTHTNAGVDALRRRLRRGGISSTRVSVDTLDGWCLRYVSSYPKLAGDVLPDADGGIDWGSLRKQMLQLLARTTIERVIRASYVGVFIDEYQDCDEHQHALASRLAELLPTRLLGDPLQAIFGFGKPLPHWTDVVEAAFPRSNTLTTPWRWRGEGANRELGEWVTHARVVIERGQRLDLRDRRIRLVEISSFNDWRAAAQEQCFELAKAHPNSTGVAILKWSSDSQMLARITGGRFQAVEAVSAKDAAQLLSALENARPPERPEVLLNFMMVVAIHNDRHLQELRNALDARACDAEHERAYSELMAVSDGGSFARAAEALDAISRLPDTRVFRRELLWSVLDSLRDAGERQPPDLVGALRRRRSLASSMGRRLSRFAAGTTLLLKGMEFDHAVVVHTGGSKGFSANNLYVALTRASKSLTIISTVSAIDVSTLPLN